MSLSAASTHVAAQPGGGVRRWAEAFAAVDAALGRERHGRPFWEGRLSTSALSTATAVSAFAVADAAGVGVPDAAPRIVRGLQWLAAHQNADGGWGDTPDSPSNIATTVLGLAAFRLGRGLSDPDGSGRNPEAGMAQNPATGTRGGRKKGSGTRTAKSLTAGSPPPLSELIEPSPETETGTETGTEHRAGAYLWARGGLAAVGRRYGRDRTFSAPILMNAALGGLTAWSAVAPLPFGLAVLPQRVYRWLGLPVVSYALPALIGVGVARHRKAAPRNPVLRLLRRLAEGPSLRRLARLIPESGGFLEAVPITAFVAMGLAAAGHGAHPAVRRGLAFLANSQRADGGWPIDVNLSVWNTTLAVNALGAGDAAARDWLLAQQRRTRHPYTGAAPGGWGWSHLTGSVPDVDDTAGALLALRRLPPAPGVEQAAEAGLRWLLAVRNRDGGWPTFCRGWQRLPFDRSAPDLTAHALRALHAWRGVFPRRLAARMDRAVRRGLKYLARVQRPDGAWVPLWFGNQAAPHQANPVIGTARVLAAYRDLDRVNDAGGVRGAAWLAAAQNADGSWGGDRGVAGTIEETALAVEALLPLAGGASPVFAGAVQRGLDWLAGAVLSGGAAESRAAFSLPPSPIGLYFAKLWYAEAMYPLVFSAAALRRALAVGGPGKEQPA